MKLWNKALLYKKIWDVENKVDRLWIRWIGAYYLNGKSLKQYKAICGDGDEAVQDSWKSMIKIRKEICGDGETKPVMPNMYEELLQPEQKDVC